MSEETRPANVTAAISTTESTKVIHRDLGLLSLRFLPGQAAKISAPNIVATVDAVQISMRGVIYSMVWWSEGARKSNWCEEYELEES